MILAGDIGGTKTLLRLERNGAVFERRYASAEFSGFEDLLRAFLAECRSHSVEPVAAERACFGVAGPVTGKQGTVTNLSWRLDAPALAAEFGIGEVLLLNDFAAAGNGIDLLLPRELLTLQHGIPDASAPRLLLGPGTGLGIAYLVRHSGEWLAVAGEAGHAGFAPRDPMQLELLRALLARRPRVEVEDVVSGRGLAAIHAFLRQREGGAVMELERTAEQGDAAAVIAEAAKTGRDPIALAAVDLFLSALGAVAGDHALGILARGGVYLAGGIAPKLLWRISEGGLLRAFNDRGAFSGLSRTMPAHVVLNERLGLLGAATIARGGKRG